MANVQQGAPAMLLNQIVALAADTTFQGQIRAAGLQQAGAILSAPSTPHARADQKERDLARAVLADGGVSLLTALVWGVATTAGFQAVVNDAGDANDPAIASAMVSQWPKLSGVDASDLGT